MPFRSDVLPLLWTSITIEALLYCMFIPGPGEEAGRYVCAEKGGKRVILGQWCPLLLEQWKQFNSHSWFA
jgi:hypothetical protein